MYDWSAFPPTLLATATGAVFASGTSGYLARRAKVARHRELISERLRSVIEALVGWNALERPSRSRQSTMSMTYGANWACAWQEQRNGAKVAAASAVLLFRLEASKAERPVAEALSEAVRWLDNISSGGSAKSDAMTRVNAALMSWWTAEYSREKCVEALLAVKREGEEA